jgi:hypothetical protein
MNETSEDGLEFSELTNQLTKEKIATKTRIGTKIVAIIFFIFMNLAIPSPLASLTPKLLYLFLL